MPIHSDESMEFVYDASFPQAKKKPLRQLFNQDCVMNWFSFGSVHVNDIVSQNIIYRDEALFETLVPCIYFFISTGCPKKKYPDLVDPSDKNIA